MIIDRLVKVIGNSKNLKYYKECGFDIKIGEEIVMDVKYLSKGSTFLIRCSCDNCGSIKEMQFGSLFKYLKGDISSDYYCSSCNKIKRMKTNNIKYGGNSPTCSKEVINKIKSTNLKKWGTTCTLHSDIISDGIKKTFMSKYGVDNPLKSKSIQDKCKKTLNRNYGVDNPLKSNIIVDRLKSTNLNRYGFENVFQDESIKKLIIDKQFEKWGKFYTQTDDMKKKSIETCIKKYSAPNYSSSIEYIRYLISTKNDKYKSLDILSYDNISKLYNIKCEECHHEFLINNDNLLSRTSRNIILCTICNPIGKCYVSGGEVEISDFLKENNIDIETTNRKLINPYHIDIIIPNNKIGIEFNGIYWHNDMFKSKTYHLNKYERCLEVGYNLLQIWEDDWYYKKDIVKSIILTKINKFEDKIFARKCVIKIVNYNEKVIFLNNNHLQGNSSSSINIGLYYNNELVSLMTFGKRRTNNKNEFELIRFCNRINTIIVGGASKLLNFFKKNYEYSEIVSYSDNSISNGDLYKLLGFEYVSTSINYYWCDGKIKHHRFNYNKKKLIKQGFDPSKTELEIMRERGFNRIWGAGNKKWVYNKKK